MTKTNTLLQLTLVLGLGLATAACETVSDAADSVGSAVSDLNPFGSSDSIPADQTADAGASSSDTTFGTTPDLANLPSRPASSTAGQQQAAAQSLAADGAQARYSADNLRAGTESAAAPPPSADAPPSAAPGGAPTADAPPSAGATASLPTPPAAPAATDAAPSATDAPPSATDAPPSSAASLAAPPAAVATRPQVQAPQAVASAPPPSALTAGTSAVPVGPSASAPSYPSAAAAPVRSAALPSSSAPLPPGAEPAVPANTPVRGGAVAMGARNPTDAALGFQPSSAPALDPSISKWVPAPIVAHYRQTASVSGSALSSNAAVPGRVLGGVSGSVLTNPLTNGGVTPTAVVQFPGDGVTLSVAARTQIRNAVAQYKASGGASTVRVVGHASSRTPNMPVEKHLEVIFNKSQARANVVAQELIHQGVPAAKVLVESVGDSQPIYYESMPQGEDGNRRTEIFVQ